MELVERYLKKMNDGWSIQFEPPCNWQWEKEFVWTSTAQGAYLNTKPNSSSGEPIGYTTDWWWS